MRVNSLESTSTPPVIHVPLVELMNLVCTSGRTDVPWEYAPLVEVVVFTRMPGESYRRRRRSLLYLCYVFRALINSLVC